jgi:hypothetical protein
MHFLEEPSLLSVKVPDGARNRAQKDENTVGLYKKQYLL